MTTARLMLAGGTGRLVRRPSVVLFDPTGQNQDLANRFDAAASDSDAVDGLKKYLIESGFTAAPLVVAQWSRGEFNLLVFGDVEVHTSAIAAPMVSGAGSSTWVERHLGAIELGPATRVEVWSGEAADPTTNLGLGVVACAGFRMSLDLANLDLGHLAGTASSESVAGEPAAASAVVPGTDSRDAGHERGGDGMTVRTEPPVPMTSFADPTIAAPRSAVSATDARTVSEPVADPTIAAPSAAVSEPVADPTIAAPRSSVPSADALAVSEPVAVPTPDDVNDESADTEDVDQPTDPFTASEAVPGTASLTPPPAPPAPEVFDADDSLTEAAPVSAAADPFGSASAADDAPRAGLIEAAHCPSGHANPPRSSACYVCGLSLLEDQSLGLIEQPTVGRIVFVGGQSLPLERAIVMGRKPDGAALGAHPVLIDHVEVSRSHALVVIEGWTVLLTDQGSRNGTWVVPFSDPTPVRLDSGVPHVLEHGTVVHLGAPEVSFTYYFDKGE